MTDKNNILPPEPGKGGAGRLPEELLLAYLDGKLPPDKQHEVELWLAEEGMESDAVEGLTELAADERKSSINKINNNLRRSLAPKTRKRNHLKADIHLLTAVFLILMLAAIAYCVIRYMK